MRQISSPDGQRECLAEEERSALDGEHVALDRELEPLATATSVRVGDRGTLWTDGAFCETSERLGGPYVVEAESLAEAIARAARIPSARHGTVEVRPAATRHDEEAA